MLIITFTEMMRIWLYNLLYNFGGGKIINYVGVGSGSHLTHYCCQFCWSDKPPISCNNSDEVAGPP